MTETAAPPSPAHDDPLDRPGAKRSGEYQASDAAAVRLAADLQRRARGEPEPRTRIGARLRTAFLTGLLIVGPVTITLYIVWGLIHWIDAWIKPLLPTAYNPDTYLPFPLPGLGLVTAIVGLTVIGALAANLLGRTLVSSGEIMLSRTPIVRNVYGAIKQVFESVLPTTGPNEKFQKVGLIEFPSKGLWSLVLVTGETGGEILDVRPGGEGDLLTVFMPTGIVPPTGFICFVPRRDVTMLKMSVEEAAKVILSGGIVIPDADEKVAPTSAAR